MNKKGFTLIELLLVIMILGLLATMLSGSFFTSLKKGRDARRKSDLNQVQKAVELYYEDQRAYPLTLDFGGQLIDVAHNKIYMQRIPNDPSSGNYGYETDAEGTYFKLYVCLENDQQVLPYVSNPASFTCSRNCKNQLGETVSCIWGISSTNTTP